MDALESGYSVEIDRISRTDWHGLLLEFDDANFYQTWSYGEGARGPRGLSHLVLRQHGRAVAMGKPIVAYDLKETRFTAGDAALYTRSGEVGAYASAIIGLMDDPARRTRLGEIGTGRIGALFQREHQSAHLLKAYEHVLGASAKTG